MDKITLVCTSLNKDPELLKRMFDSANGFDFYVIHIDGNGISIHNKYKKKIDEYYFPARMNVQGSYNFLIKEFVKTEWVCCMPDDDYFLPIGLNEMLTQIHLGVKEDVAHYKIMVNGYLPKQDIRGRVLKLFGQHEYVLCERTNITPKLLKKHGRMPAGTFFRKTAWERGNYFQNIKENDRALWTAMAEAGCTFKFFDYLVYNYVRRPGSLWLRED